MKGWTRFLRVAVIFTLGFFLSVIYQNLGGVLFPKIRECMCCSDALFDLVTATQFIAMGLGQLPVGILLDYYGPRRVQAGAFVIAGLGAGCYALAVTPWMLIVGRTFIGLGMGGALMVAFKAVSTFYSYKEIPFWNNFIFCVGSLGIIAVGLPLYTLLENWMNWREVLFGLALLTLLMGALFFFVVPEDPHQRVGETASFAKVVSGLKRVLKDRFFWKIAPLMVSVLGVVNACQGLWMVVWLVEVEGIEASAAADHLFYMGMGTILGALSSLAVIRLVKRFGITIDWVMAWGCLAAIAIQFLIVLQMGATTIVWFFYAFFSIFTLLSYAALMQYFPKEYAGRATTALNMLFFFGLVIFQYFFGLLAQVCSSGPSADYKSTFWIYIAIQFLAFIWFCSQKRFRLKEPVGHAK